MLPQDSETVALIYRASLVRATAERTIRETREVLAAADVLIVRSRLSLAAHSVVPSDAPPPDRHSIPPQPVTEQKPN